MEPPESRCEITPTSTFHPGRRRSSQQREKRWTHICYICSMSITEPGRVETLMVQLRSPLHLADDFIPPTTSRFCVSRLFIFTHCLMQTISSTFGPSMGVHKSFISLDCLWKRGETDCRSMLMCSPIKLIFDWGHRGQVARGWSP